MSEFVFLFAVHNHQPVGNFRSVFEKAFDDCYRPFLQAVRKHPSLKLTLHFSGPLWEYMLEKEKECWDAVQDMVGKGQAELLGGGFYEPILSIIPEEDRIGQVELMNRFLEEHFKKSPRGAWLTERVWEPNLPKSLAKAGIEYTLLDEEHFHYAGIKNIHTSYITEDEGCPLRLFPIDKKLRYLIPFRGLEEIRNYFTEIAGKGGAAILGDDGEKFGLWPGTHKWVYEEGWLKTFLVFLEKEGIRTLTYSEYLDANPPSGRVYLPPASYEEMMEWVLEPEELEAFKTLKSGVPDESRRFLRGGYFRDFLIKYRESNHLHKRMLLVSREVTRQRNEDARRLLYKGQGNDPFWHGVFGGLYLPHLREAAYYHLLEAEKKLVLKPGWEVEDFDLDGSKEFLHRDEIFNILLKPSFGGGIIEVDYKPLSRNLSDVLARRKESYHQTPEEKKGEGRSIHELAKEIPAQDRKFLRYDWHPRFSALDHFLHPLTTQEDFQQMSYGEQGDFVNQEYFPTMEKKSLVLDREGTVWIGDFQARIFIRKKITAEKEGFRVAYELENRSDRDIRLFFGSEWNFSLFPGEAEFSKNKALFLMGKLVFEPDHPHEIWHFPLETLSQSEEGYDIIRQGICILPVWKFSLAKHERFFTKINILRKNDDR